MTIIQPTPETRELVAKMLDLMGARAAAELQSAIMKNINEKVKANREGAK